MTPCTGSGNSGIRRSGYCRRIETATALRVSHLLHVWESPLPTSVAEAIAIRPLPAARLAVTFGCESRTPAHEVWVHTRLVMPGSQPLALLQLLAPDAIGFGVNHGELAAAAGLVWPRPSHTDGMPAIVATPDELQALCAHWQQRLDAVLLPLVEQGRSLRGLEQLLREHPQWFSLQQASLALSAACGRSDLPAMAEQLIARSTIHWHDSTREWLAFLQAAPTVDLGPPLTDAVLALRAMPLMREGRPVLPAGPEGLGPAFDEQPVTRRFVGTHHVVHAVDEGGTGAHVQQHHVAALQRTPQQLHEQAPANLSARAAAGWQLQADGPLERLHLDGRHDACLMLLDALWRGPLAAHTPGGALAAIPGDGERLFCDVTTPGGLIEATLEKIPNRPLRGGRLSTTVRARPPQPPHPARSTSRPTSPSPTPRCCTGSSASTRWACWSATARKACTPTTFRSSWTPLPVRRARCAGMWRATTRRGSAAPRAHR